MQSFDVDNEVLHGSFFTDALQCAQDSTTGAWSPCICDYGPACPADLGVNRRVDVLTWMHTAVSRENVYRQSSTCLLLVL